MHQEGCYLADNPLLGVISRGMKDDADDDDAGSQRPPRMPDISGVEPQRSRRRLTDSFFELRGKEWIPQIIDDPTFPVSELTGGRKLSGWGLREECVTRLLFETGGRLFEVTTRRLGNSRPNEGSNCRFKR